MTKVLVEGMATDTNTNEELLLDGIVSEMDGVLEMVKVYDDKGENKKFRVTVTVQEIKE
jgi:transcription antitermination factor NusA-like protein